MTAEAAVEKQLLTCLSNSVMGQLYSEVIGQKQVLPNTLTCCSFLKKMLKVASKSMPNRP